MIAFVIEKENPRRKIGKSGKIEFEFNFLDDKQFHHARLMKETKLFLGNASVICSQHFFMMIYAIRFTACYLGEKEEKKMLKEL